MAIDKPQDSSGNQALRQAQQIEADGLLVNTDPVATARRLTYDAIMLKNDDKETREAVMAEIGNYNKTAAAKLLPNIWISLGSPYGPGDPSMANDVTVGAQSAFGARPDGRVVSAAGDAYGYQGITVAVDDPNRQKKSDPADELGNVKKYERYKP